MRASVTQTRSADPSKPDAAGLRPRPNRFLVAHRTTDSAGPALRAGVGFLTRRRKQPDGRRPARRLVAEGMVEAQLLNRAPRRQSDNVRGAPPAQPVWLPPRR